jgi:hypothetical protein
LARRDSLGSLLLEASKEARAARADITRFKIAVVSKSAFGGRGGRSLYGVFLSKVISLV